MDWDIFKIYTDPGYSGGSLERPGLQSMIHDVRSGLVDKVVVYKLDRLSRSQKDTMLLIEDEFLAHGVDFVSMSENFDTSTSFGRAMIGILAVFAQLERENIKERTKMGKEARAKEGKWGGGSSEPIGYDYDPNTELLVVNEYERMQILEAVDLALKGTPFRTICTIFEDKGYQYHGRSKKISKWDTKRLKYVFSSKVYLGYISYAGEWFKGEHEPIIDEETYDQLQKLLELREEKYANHRAVTSRISTYLGGILYCKRCGAKFTKQRGSRRNPTSPEPPVYYTCNSRVNKVKKMVKDPNCKNKNWRREQLDEIVLNEIRKLSVDPNYINDLKELVGININTIYIIFQLSYILYLFTDNEKQRTLMGALPLFRFTFIGNEGKIPKWNEWNEKVIFSGKSGIIFFSIPSPDR